eukprot:scaffold15712_cov84-Isochrysis_galbana.AAC.4
MQSVPVPQGCFSAGAILSVGALSGQADYRRGRDCAAGARLVEVEPACRDARHRARLEADIHQRRLSRPDRAVNIDAARTAVLRGIPSASGAG